MEQEFRNVDPHFIQDRQAREAGETLWSTTDGNAFRDAVASLLTGDDILGKCAVFELFSYSCTTAGDHLRVWLGEFEPQIVASARSLMRADLSACPHRNLLIASLAHVVWRSVDPVDGPFLLAALREEDWRIVWPAVSAAYLIKGLDPGFDAELSPLLVRIAHRAELSSLIRRIAVQAIGEHPSESDLHNLLALMLELPLPTSAACALALLEYDAGRFEVPVRDAVATWPETEEYPAPSVLERLARPQQ